VAGLVRFRGAWPAGALRRIAGTLGRRG